MQLNRLEIAVLKRLQKYRCKEPTLGERLLLMLVWMLVLLVLCSALGILLARTKIPSLWAVPIGIYLGALGREISVQRRYVKWWPINREITDWTRVEQLLSHEPIAVSGAPSTRTRTKWAVAIGVSAFAVIFGLFVVTDQTLAYVYNPTRHNAPDNVIVLSASWCPHCEHLRRHLLESHIDYTELDVDHTTEGRWAFYALHGTGIPITIVGDQVIRGTKWEKLDNALTKAGYTPTPVSNQVDRTPTEEASSLR
jgi:glutaredoxin